MTLENSARFENLLLKTREEPRMRSRSVLFALTLILAPLRMLVGQEVQYPDLPKGITSFGAAVAGDWLYVYGGHFGQAHHYSTAGQSNELSRVNLRKPKQWEVVAHGPKLQGLAMVAYQGKLLRLGGFTARNQEGEDHDLESVAEVASFDPEKKRWEVLPALPEPRSSFDAVIIGDLLYVAGGWQLDGQETTWRKTAWVMDLSKDVWKWKPLPTPPFQRRALSLGHQAGRLFVIGGMQPDRKSTTRVDIYDAQSQTWSEGPELAGEAMEGFGSAAFTVKDQLFVSTLRGNVQRLSADASAWRTVHHLEEDRFFHRMLPYQDQLIFVGGASMEEGKRQRLETVVFTALK